MALVVDELVGQQDIVIKSLGRRLANVRGIAGATELGDQQTILVIDMVELLNELSSDQSQTVEAR
jgi:two-component system, chemotaxis family, sensor kinase CheA